MDQSNARTRTMVFTGIGIFLLLFVAVSVLSFVRRQNEAKKQEQSHTTGVSKSSGVTNKTATPLASFPKVSVGTWNILGAAAIAGSQPEQAHIYALRSHLTKNDFAALSLKLNLQPQTASETDERVIGGRTQNTESAMLYLQKTSGAFLYRATDAFGQGSTQAAQLEPQRIQEFASKLTGDSNVRFSATYQKKSMPGVIYYEFHRDAGAAGLPIVGMHALFNLPDKTKLADLDKSRGQTVALLPREADITSTSDQTDGRARANDFNTLTVGVKAGKVVTVVSKMRWLGDKGSVVSVLPYVDAVKKLEANQFSQVLTSPAGTGKLDHATIYPNNKAAFRSVTVTDSRLVYLEELSDTAQSELAPYYVFRGYGVLTSGYRANVLAAVAAAPSTVLGAATAQTPLAFNATQKQGSLSLDKAPTTTPTLIPSPTPRPQATLAPLQNQKVSAQSASLFTSKCIVPPTINDLSNLQTDQNGVVYGQLPRTTNGSTDGVDTTGEWYMIPTSALDVAQFNDILDSIYTKISATRSIYAVTLEYERSAGNLCAIRI